MRLFRRTLTGLAVVAWVYFAFYPRDRVSAGPALLEPDAPTVIVRADIVHASEELAIPTDLEVVGGHLVLVDRYADHPIHIVDATEGELLRSLGRAGDGPGEYRQLSSIAPVPGSSTAFWAYDMGLARLTYVDLADEGTLQRPWEARLMTLQSDGARVTGIEWTSEDRFLAAGFFPDGRLGEFGADGEMRGVLGALPSNPNHAPASVLQHAYMGTLKAHPEGSRLALALRHASVIEIRDADGSLIARTVGPQEDFEPKFETADTERGAKMRSGSDMRFGYIDMAVTGDRIYGLFSGRTREGYSGRATLGRYIHVFDWDGTLEEVIEVEDDLIAIAVPSDGSTLYAVRHDPVPAVLALQWESETRLAVR